MAQTADQHWPQLVQVAVPPVVDPRTAAVLVVLAVRDVRPLLPVVLAAPVARRDLSVLLAPVSEGGRTRLLDRPEKAQERLDVVPPLRACAALAVEQVVVPLLVLGPTRHLAAVAGRAVPLVALHTAALPLRTVVYAALSLPRFATRIGRGAACVALHRLVVRLVRARLAPPPVLVVAQEVAEGPPAQLVVRQELQPLAVQHRLGHVAPVQQLRLQRPPRVLAASLVVRVALLVTLVLVVRPLAFALAEIRRVCDVEEPVRKRALPSLRKVQRLLALQLGVALAGLSVVLIALVSASRPDDAQVADHLPAPFVQLDVAARVLHTVWLKRLMEPLLVAAPALAAPGFVAVHLEVAGVRTAAWLLRASEQVQEPLQPLSQPLVVLLLAVVHVLFLLALALSRHAVGQAAPLRIREVGRLPRPLERQELLAGGPVALAGAPLVHPLLIAAALGKRRAVQRRPVVLPVAVRIVVPWPLAVVRLRLAQMLAYGLVLAALRSRLLGKIHHPPLSGRARRPRLKQRHRPDLPAVVVALVPAVLVVTLLSLVVIGVLAPPHGVSVEPHHLAVR